MSPDPRAKFRALTRVFDPIYRPYLDADDGPGSSYVPEAHEHYRAELEAALDLNDNAKLLLAGQPGCGKTTLLLSIAHRLRREGRLVAFVDLEAQTAVQDLGSLEMYLAAKAELVAEVKQAGISLSEKTTEMLRSALERLLGSPVTPDLDALGAALRRLLSTVRESKLLRDELRRQIKESGFEPIDMLAGLLDDLEEHSPVVLLDGLDKLPPVQARDAFLGDEKKPMVEAPGAAILTIPISLIYEPTFNVLSERYNNAGSAVLPAVRLYDLNPHTNTRRRSEQGVSIMRRIVEARVEPIDARIVMPEAVERAIVGSGGNIRELARLLQSSVVKAHVRRGTFIEEQDVAAAIADQRESFRRAYDPRFLSVLEKVRREFRLEGQGDVTKQLLYGLWVIEYRNGIAWYSLPDPVEQLLRQMETWAG
ncbi:AAA family ATPase [Polyangium fumosum]|uniref:ATP-binding protein n=1 Tax=Polyangium fumosum TaxID=889272 RepID=A0A4U1J5E2_9BACT|nr:AAA family ATPase [Polyangium fumosum]TKD02478.1 ATP-binding protein [Polyangium fumosum]